MDCKNRIIKLRESTGLNRKDFCKLVHIPYRTMTEWELDNRHAPDYVLWLATVYKGNIIKNLILDCQSYTKYRPNETTGGIFVSWRRKEEPPTGA